MAVGGVLFDIDGVLVTSWRPIEGAAETLRVLADNQIARSYLTNTTTRTRRQIAGLLTDAGMDVDADEVITAAALTAEYVRGQYPGARCFLVNSGQIAEDMPGIDIVYASDSRRRRGARNPRRDPARRCGPRIQPPDAQPRLRLDGPGRTGGGHAPQHVVEHRRGPAHRHRHVPDRDGGDVGSQGQRRRQAGPRGIPCPPLHVSASTPKRCT